MTPMTHDRRTFLTALGGAALGLTARKAFALDVGFDRAKLRRIGIQLYTMRGPASKDLAGTLARLAKIGYKEIEFAGYYGHPAGDVRRMLDANGLTAPSAHIQLSDIENKASQTFADAHAVGHEWITVPMLAGNRDTVDAWKRVADQFNSVAATVKQAGFRFAYHNHNMEFRKIGNTLPLDVLVSNTDPSLVSYEMDIYWVVNGGGDPLALLAKYPGRFKMLHVKDSAGPPDQKMVDVGAGTIDFKTIFARAKGIEHYFVEHDEPPNPFVDAAASYKYLANLTF